MKWLAPALLLLAGCRGQPSSDPPLHLAGDMDWQPKYRPQAESAFFSDRRAMRPLVEGTLARGWLDRDGAFYTGKDAEGFLASAPVEADEKVLARGRQRYGIYCSPCHDETGSGRGIVVRRGFPLPVRLGSERVRRMPDGQIFDVITNGARRMPAHGGQIPADDRWAIALWVRALGPGQPLSPGDAARDVEPERTSR